MNHPRISQGHPRDFEPPESKIHITLQPLGGSMLVGGTIACTTRPQSNLKFPVRSVEYIQDCVFFVGRK